MTKEPGPFGIQRTARSVPSRVWETPATTPAALIAPAPLIVPPGSVPKLVMLNVPEPVGVQTTAWLGPVGVLESPATWPDGLMATPELEVSPGRVAKAVIPT